MKKIIIFLLFISFALFLSSCEEKKEEHLNVNEFLAQYEKFTIDFSKDFMMEINKKDDFISKFVYDKNNEIIQIYFKLEKDSVNSGEFINYIMKDEDNKYAFLSISKVGKFVEYYEFNNIEEAFNELILYHINNMSRFISDMIDYLQIIPDTVHQVSSFEYANGVYYLEWKDYFCYIGTDFRYHGYYIDGVAKPHIYVNYIDVNFEKIDYSSFIFCE